MRPSAALSVLLLLCSLAPAQNRTIPLVVTSSWLAEHQSDADLVILQVAFNRAEYRAGHIPGARFLWFNGLTTATPDATTEMPTVVQADTLLENLGITARSKIVLVFGGTNLSTTTRMLLTLCYFGLEKQVGFLDGGLERWKAEQRPVSTETPVVKTGSLALTVHPEVLATAEMVRDNLTNPNVDIIDARTKNFYDGQGGGSIRQGHIKGAKSVPYSAVLDSLTRLKDLSALKKVFEDAGIKPGDKLISYCHVGQQACVIFLVARLLGYDAAVYDGSFEDWNTRGDEYPVEKTITPQG